MRYVIYCQRIATGIVLLLSAVPAAAGIFDDPGNLKVLPKDISAGELRETMQSFARGTGTRCSGCHVGEVEADLSTYDFSLDDKEKKRKAREMIKLVRTINDRLASIFPEAFAAGASVTCATCHRGLPKPEMIEDVLTAEIEKGGPDAGIDRYGQLREQYFGSYSYDFSERMLMRMASDFGSADQVQTALALINLNLEHYPSSSRSYVIRAQLHEAVGDTTSARQDYSRALEFEPDSAWIRKQLDALR